MNEDWQPSPVLIGEADYWDPDQAKLRRELTGVAQGLLDLQAIAVHQKRDPDRALADWEQHARNAGSDDMETFNEFTRQWRYGDLGGYVFGGAGHPFLVPPFTGGLYLVQGTANWGPAAPVLHQYLHQYGKVIGSYPTTARRRTAREVREQFDQFAAEHKIDPEGLWQEFNEFYVTTPLDLEGAAESFLGSKRLALIPVEITIRIANSFNESLEQVQAAMFKFCQVAAMTPEEIAEAAAPVRLCYRCARDHGSGPCRPTRR